jgi:hypothetical protein
MKNTTRIALASLLVLFGTSALPFEDGFEASASTCWGGVKVVDALNDTQTAVLVKPGALVCLDGTTAKFDCVLDASGACKRESAPVPPTTPTCRVPDGFKVTEKTWAQMFYGATAPSSPSYLAPVGSFTLRNSMSKQGLPVAGKILTTSFVADAKAHNIRWLQVQPIPAAGYGWPNPARTATVTISQCRGDVFAACQATAREGRLYYGPTAAIAECRVTAGVKYWLSVHFSPPGFDPNANTCMAGALCDINVKAQ